MTIKNVAEKPVSSWESGGNQVMNAMAPTVFKEIKQSAKYNMALLFQLGCFDCENEAQNEENKIWCLSFFNLLLNTGVFKNTTILAILVKVVKKKKNHWYWNAFFVGI